MEILKSIWTDDVGFIVSIELILIATIMVIGLITGFTAVRDAVICELSDVGGAIQDLNQSYSFNGVTGHSGFTVGSDYLDARDHCDDRDDPTNRADNCILFNRRPVFER